MTTVSTTSGIPKLLSQTGKERHTSGIFAMDVSKSSSMVATGSKDKTIAVSQLESLGQQPPMWTSDYHSAKVGAVQFRGNNTTLLGSASDDGNVAIHDYRSQQEVVAALEDAHVRPHSIVWEPHHEHVFLTGTFETDVAATIPFGSL